MDLQESMFEQAVTDGAVSVGINYDTVLFTQVPKRLGQITLMDYKGKRLNKSDVFFDEVESGGKLKTARDVSKLLSDKVISLGLAFLGKVIECQFEVREYSTSRPHDLLVYRNLSNGVENIMAVVVRKPGTLHWEDFKPHRFPGAKHRCGTPLTSYKLSSLTGAAVNLVKEANQLCTETGIKLCAICDYDSVVFIDNTPQSPRFVYFSKNEQWIHENLASFFYERTGRTPTLASLFFWAVETYLQERQTTRLQMRVVDIGIRAVERVCPEVAERARRRWNNARQQ